MLPIADGHVAVLRKNKMTRETMIRRRCARAARGMEVAHCCPDHVSQNYILLFYFLSLSLSFYLSNAHTTVVLCAGGMGSCNYM